MSISGSTVLALIVAAILVYFIFFSRFPIPGWLRTVFAIALAVIAFVWLLNLLGLVIF